MENICAIWTHRVYAFLLPPSTEIERVMIPRVKAALMFLPRQHIQGDQLEDEHRREGEGKHLLTSK